MSRKNERFYFKQRFNQSKADGISQVFLQEWVEIVRDSKYVFQCRIKDQWSFLRVKPAQSSRPAAFGSALPNYRRFSHSGAAGIHFIRPSILYKWNSTRLSVAISLFHPLPWLCLSNDQSKLMLIWVHWSVLASDRQRFQICDLTSGFTLYFNST